jgi:hypothetical protein
MGLLTFVLLWAASLSLKRTLLHPTAAPRVVIREKFSPFDSERALTDLERIAALEKSEPGAEGGEKIQDYIREELNLRGVEMRDHVYEANAAEGSVPRVNLTAVIEGTEAGVIVLGTRFYAHRTVGVSPNAALGDAPTATWMLELARALGPKREGRTLWLTWLGNSRAWLGHLRETGEIDDVRAMLHFSGIGDCQLGIQCDQAAPELLSGIIWDTAQRLGYGKHFSQFRHQAQTDTLPFRQSDIPAIGLLDPGRPAQSFVHTPAPTLEDNRLDTVCAGSLQAVADVIYHALPALEAALDAEGTP